MSNPFNLLPSTFKGKSGEVTLSEVKENDIVGIYFSAHWCPPCRGFTPELAKFYENVKGQGKKFEIIFVSSDRDQDSFNEYYGTMPWIAVEFGNDSIPKIKSEYQIRGIPTLLIFNKKGEMIDREGRKTVCLNPNGAYNSWIGQ